MPSTIIFRFSLLVLLLTSINAWSQDGRILSFEGDVRVNGQPLSASTVLKADDTIMTAPDASVRIVLSDNSVLDLDGGTQIELSDYSFDPAQPEENSSHIDVLAGSLRYVSGRIAKDDPEKISFTAGNSTIGVRGTFISIAVCPEAGCE